MSARSLRIPGGWLSVCSRCGVESFALTLVAAEKAGKAHVQAKHPRPVQPVQLDANGVLW